MSPAFRRADTASPPTAKRASLAALLVLVLFGAMGCGGGSDQDQVRDTAQSFLRGLGDRDAQVVCGVYPDDEGAILTSDAYDQLSDSLFAGHPCTASLEDASEIPGVIRSEVKGILDDLKFEDVEDVEVSGDEARVETDGGLDLKLVKDEGAWVIEDPGLSP